PVPADTLRRRAQVPPPTREDPRRILPNAMVSWRLHGTRPARHTPGNDTTRSEPAFLALGLTISGEWLTERLSFPAVWTGPCLAWVDGLPMKTATVTVAL